MIGINDNGDFRNVKKALDTLNFSEQEQKDIFNIISAILHLGNVTFMEEEGHSTILKLDLVETVSKVCIYIQGVLIEAYYVFFIPKLVVSIKIN